MRLYVSQVEFILATYSILSYFIHLKINHYLSIQFVNTTICYPFHKPTTTRLMIHEGNAAAYGGQKAPFRVLYEVLSGVVVKW